MTSKISPKHRDKGEHEPYSEYSSRTQTPCNANAGLSSKDLTVALRSMPKDIKKTYCNEEQEKIVTQKKKLLRKRTKWRYGTEEYTIWNTSSREAEVCELKAQCPEEEEHTRHPSMEPGHQGDGAPRMGGKTTRARPSPEDACSHCPVTPSKVCNPQRGMESLPEDGAGGPGIHMKRSKQWTSLK